MLTTQPDPVPVVRWSAVRAALLVNLAVEVLIVLTGGLVRLTGSGLGCPTWPECVDGSITPVVEQAEGYHKYIEFGNRTLTSVVALAAVAALLAVRHVVRRSALPRTALVLGAMPLLLVVAQAVLGGITVLTQLHPATVAAHFLLSMVTIAVCTWLVLVVRPGSPGVTRQVHPSAVALATSLALALTLGTLVTGSGPHSGDAETPNRFAVDAEWISRIHSGSSWLFLALAVTTWFAARQARGPLRWVLALTLAQGAVGYLQYFNGLPEPLVALHMLLASLMVVAVTAVVAGSRGTLAQQLEAQKYDSGTNGSTATATNSTVR